MTEISNIKPSPEDIERAIQEMREGRNAYANWTRDCLDDAVLPCWVDPINPDGAETDPCGGGHTYEEAAAAAWIGLNRTSGALSEPLSKADYAAIPREVPAGWRFVPYQD